MHAARCGSRDNRFDVLDRAESVPLRVAKISDTSSHPRLESAIWGFNPVNPVAEPKQYIEPRFALPALPSGRPVGFHQTPLSLPVILNSNAAAVARQGNRLRRSVFRSSPFNIKPFSSVA